MEISFVLQMWSQFVTTSEEQTSMRSQIVTASQGKRNVEIRRILIQETDLRKQLNEIRERLGEHDTQLNAIYDAMENLLDEKAAQRKFEERGRIGFKVTG